MRINRAIAVFSIVMAFLSHSQAAVINWSTPSMITGDSDISTEGSLVYAYSFGNSGTVTVNGVPFQGAIPTYNTTLNQFQYLGGNVDLYNGNTSTSYGSPPTISPTSSYALLTGAAARGSAQTPFMQLNIFVTPGQSYLLQF